MGKDGLDFPGNRDQEVKRVLLRERHGLLCGNPDGVAVCVESDTYAGLLIRESAAYQDLAARDERSSGSDGKNLSAAGYAC